MRVNHNLSVRFKAIRLNLQIEAASLGIKRTDNNVASALLWSFDNQNGNWQRQADFLFPANINDNAKAVAQPEFPSEYPIIKNIDKPIPAWKMCEVRWFAFRVVK